MIELCFERGTLYLDTVTEPWEGGYTDTSLSIVDRSNYGQRQEVVDLKQRLRREHPEGTATAVTVRRSPPVTRNRNI